MSPQKKKRNVETGGFFFSLLCEEEVSRQYRKRQATVFKKNARFPGPTPPVKTSPALESRDAVFLFLFNLFPRESRQYQEMEAEASALPRGPCCACHPELDPPLRLFRLAVTLTPTHHHHPPIPPPFPPSSGCVCDRLQRTHSWQGSWGMVVEGGEDKKQTYQEGLRQR